MMMTQVFMEVYEGQSERVGSLHSDGDGFHLVIRGWRQGKFVAKTNSKFAPYIDGKLYGVYINDDGKRKRQYAGKIWAHDNEVGEVLYSGVLEIQPELWGVLRVVEK